MGVPKPFYFPVMPSYWFPIESKPLDDGPSPMHGSVEEGTAPKIPIETVNESILGPPVIIVNKLRKTFGEQVAVNDLSFKMYENQIFALLGHNGAGKVI